MSAETSHPISPAGGANEPAKESTVPVWLIVLVVVLLYGGAVYFDEHGGWFNPEVYGPYRSVTEIELYQPKTEGPDLSQGKRNFELICALCHGANGAGTAQAPPLAGSEWASGSPERMIRIPLYGLSGTVTVKGQAYNFASSMGPMGAGLSPEDLALVLTYIRSSWGNNGSPITAAQVSAVKTQVGNRPIPFTVDELNAIH